AARATARRGGRSPPRWWSLRSRPAAAGPRRAAAASVEGERRPSLLDGGHLDRPDIGQIARDLLPAIALVGTCEHLARAGPEVQARRLVAVDRHPLAQDAEIGIGLRQTLVEPLPALT